MRAHRLLWLLALGVVTVDCASTNYHAWRYTNANGDEWTVDEIDRTAIKEHIPSVFRVVRASTGRVSTTNAAWTAPFVFDGANSSGCASDDNNGTSATCGGAGVGPLLHHTEAYARWGPTGCPNWNGDVTYTWLSGSPSTDPFFPCGQVTPTTASSGASGPSVMFLGTRQGSTQITLGTVTPKSKPGKQPLAVDFGTSVTLFSEVQNLTHPSIAYVISLVSGTNYRMSQPMPALTHPTGSGKGYSGATAPVLGKTWPEVDTWATGDTVIVSTYPGVYMTGTVNQNFGGANNTGVLQFARLHILDSGPVNNQGSSGFFLNQSAEVAESVVDRSLQPFVVGIPDSKVGTSFGLSGLYNVIATNGFMGGNYAPGSTIDTTPFPILAGAILTNPNASTISLNGVALDDDVLVLPNQSNQCYINGYNLVGTASFTRSCVMLTAGAVVDMCSRALSSITSTTTRSMWSTSTSTAATFSFNVGFGHLIYPGSGCQTVAQQTAVNTFFEPLIVENSNTSMCATTQAQPSVTNCGLPFSTADLDAPAGLTALAGGGTFTLTNGSAAVTNVAGSFTTQLLVNQHFTCDSQQGTFYQISAIGGNDRLTLSGNYTGPTTNVANCFGVGYGGIVKGPTGSGIISNTTWGPA